MTNEEAREILQQIRKQKCVTECDYSCKLYESETFCLEEKALDIAIKALEQTELNPSYNSVKTELKSSEDCISRTELLSRIDAERKHLLDLKMDGAEHIIVHYTRRIIEDMPNASSVDCIDRQKTIAEIQDKYYDNAIGIDVVDMIAHMPAAIPEQLGEHFAEGYKKGIENE